MLSSLFKPPKHNRFEYTPRYYDEIKEDIDQRKRHIHFKIEEQKKSGVKPTLDHISLKKGFLHHDDSSLKKFRFYLSPEWLIALLVSALVYYKYGIVYFVIPLVFPFMFKRIRRRY